MAREYAERQAFLAMEDAASHASDQRIMRRNHSTVAPTPPSPRAAHLTKSNSCIEDFSTPRRGRPMSMLSTVDSSEETGQGLLYHRLHPSKSSGNIHHNHSHLHQAGGADHGGIPSSQTASGLQAYAVDGPSYGVMHNVKKKLSDNLEHYSNMFHQVALPMLFGKGKTPRSRSQSREGRRSQSQGRATKDNGKKSQLTRGLSSDRRGNHHHSGGGVNGERHSDEDDYVFVEHIELQQMDGFSWSAAPQKEVGKGHDFVTRQLKNSTWCDKCGDFIWGINKRCFVCANCQYTCHHKCRPEVTLDCASVSGDDNSPDRNARNENETSLSQREQVQGQPQADDADSGYHTGSNTLQSKAQRAAAAGGAGGAPQPVAPRPPGEWTLTREELRRQIEAFNNNNHGLIMSLQQETNTFQGFIRVHMNLIRPINMSLSARPASIYDVMGQSDDEESDTEAEITSFYLPKDTTKVIHINSSTTTQEVIRTLLSKFKITDNPRKFALYEKIQEEGKKDLMRRLEDAEQPLPCCLSWTLESLALLDKRKFVLQENDTGEIMWEAFSLPELENFLRILDREEDEYVDQVKAKYRMLRVQMQQRLKDLEPASEPPSGEDKREPVYV